MKKVLILAAILTYHLHGTAQNKFPANGSAGIGTTTPHTSSILEVKSTTQGVLLPRMTKAQRDAIKTPAEGLFIYQTDNTPGLYYYNNGWKSVIVNAANKSLSNLAATTAINADLLPVATGAKSLGSSSFAWKDLHLTGNVYIGGFQFSSRAGSASLFVGDEANHVNTASDNTGFGVLALGSNTTGSENTAHGTFALVSNATGSNNTAVGANALLSNIAGNNNAAVGTFALSGNKGDGNTAVGSYAAGYGSSTYSTFIGYTAYGGQNITNATAIGSNAYVGASNKVVIGNYAVTSIGGYANWTNFSDGRYKQNKKADVPGLSFIRELKPLTYTLDVNGIDNFIKGVNSNERKQNGAMTAEEERAMNEAKEVKSKVKYSGFIAQDVEAAAKKLGYDFSGVARPKDDKDFYGLRYADFVVPMVKAIQELDEENKMLKKELEEIKGMIAASQNTTVSSTKMMSSNGNFLEQNYPNPTGRSTNIPVHLPKGTMTASIVIMETLTGKTVKTIPVAATATQVTVQTDVLPSGTYAYTLVADGRKLDTKQMVIAK